LKYKNEVDEDELNGFDDYLEMEKGSISHRSVVKSPIINAKEKLKTIYGEFVNLKKSS